MVVYELYLRDRIKEFNLIEILPERRKNPQRITQQAIMKWVKLFTGDHLNLNNIYIIQKQIQERIVTQFFKLKGESIIKSTYGLLPICSCCKKIKDEEGCWTSFETYLQNHLKVKFSLGICPQCVKEASIKWEYFDNMKKEERNLQHLRMVYEWLIKKRKGGVIQKQLNTFYWKRHNASSKMVLPFFI